VRAGFGFGAIAVFGAAAAGHVAVDEIVEAVAASQPPLHDVEIVALIAVRST
jgi:hypothetical protein